MKTLELNNLPTPVLLVWGLPEDAKLIEVRPHQIRNAVHEENCYAAFSGDTYLFRSPFKIELVGKLSELTETVASKLVGWNYYDMGTGGYINYGNSDPWDASMSPLESFHSAIEAEGHYITNPVPVPECVDAGPYGGGYDSKWIKEYEEAQSKTLPANTLIFKKS